MSVPVIFTWEQPEGGSARGEGITRDVSANGAYIFSASCPPANAMVNIEIQISQFPDAPTVLMTARMQTRRVDHTESEEEEVGFAVAGKGFVPRQLLRRRPTIVPPKKSPRPRSIEPYKPNKGIGYEHPERRIVGSPSLVCLTDGLTVRDSDLDEEIDNCRKIVESI